MRDTQLPGRNYVVSTIPFANPGDAVRSVDNIRRQLGASPVTTVTTDRYSLLYSMDEGMSELYDLSADPSQHDNVISNNIETSREIHDFLIEFMRETNVPSVLLDPRLQLRI